jgi:hypothetical protein
MTREESLDSTHLAAEGMRSEILENTDIDVDPDGTEALLTHSQDMIDKLRTMPLGDTPLERLFAQLPDQASDIFSGGWVTPRDLIIRLRDRNYP